MGGINTYSYAMASPLVKIDPEGLATCLYSISAGEMYCISTVADKGAFRLKMTCGNNGNNSNCKNNPDCTDRKNRGCIPQGLWEWTSETTGKLNGRVLAPMSGTDTFDRSLFQTHRCLNPFGPSKSSPYCSEGCITGTVQDARRLNRLLDAEPNSILIVRD